MNIASRLVPFVLLAFASCSSDVPSRETGAGALDDDHVLSGVPVLAFGVAAFGHVGGDQIDAYTIALHNGDKIELEMKGEDDLNPSATLFAGLSTKVSSASYQAGLQSIVKRYEITSSGTYYVIARAYQGEGEGDYNLWARCTGGPCAGEPAPVEPLSAWQAGECIRLARVCAIGRMATDPSIAAAALLDGCLGETRVDDLPCANACSADGPESAPELCDNVRSLLPFYAGQSAECRTTFTSCMDDCAEAGSDAETDFEDVTGSSEAMCLYSGFNGDCDTGYARELLACGGTLDPESNEACHLHCEATFGVWTDDLDEICDEECWVEEEEDPPAN